MNKNEMITKISTCLELYLEMMSRFQSDKISNSQMVVWGDVKDENGVVLLHDEVIFLSEPVETIKTLYKISKKPKFTGFILDNKFFKSKPENK